VSTFITIGTQTLNVDLVVKIEDKDEELTVYFVGPSTNLPGVQIAHMKGTEAELLRWWIEQTARNIAQEKAPDETVAPTRAVPTAPRRRTR